MSTSDEGIACGPAGMYAIDAEIVVEDEGRNVYLHAQWISEVGDTVSFEATTESIYDVYEELNKINGNPKAFPADAFDKVIEKRNRIQQESSIAAVFSGYEEQYDQMVQMIREVLDRDGYEYDWSEEWED